ncbi:MAG: hypothetical protein ACK4F0_03435 [Candidatus Ratteibacteria bacterium]
MKIGDFLLDEIYCGDALKLLKRIPDETIDLVITDPPFAIDFKGKKNNYNRKNEKVIDGYNEIPKEKYYEFTYRKEIRKHLWAKEMNSNPSKYNLFFTQSPRGIVSIKQVLDYVIHRWGVPLCCFLIMEKDLEKQNKKGEKYESSDFLWNRRYKS